MVQTKTMTRIYRTKVDNYSNETLNLYNTRKIPIYRDIRINTGFDPANVTIHMAQKMNFTGKLSNN